MPEFGELRFGEGHTRIVQLAPPLADFPASNVGFVRVHLITCERTLKRRLEFPQVFSRARIERLADTRALSALSAVNPQKI